MTKGSREQKGPIFVNQGLFRSEFYRNVMSYSPNGGVISPQEIIDSFGRLASDAEFASPGVTTGSQYPESNLLVLVSNSVVQQTYIDYVHPAYFNVRRPWIGSADSSIKLSDKGTLSEGTAKIDDQTIKTFLDFIPTTVEAAAKAAPAFATLMEGKGVSPKEAVKASVVVTATVEPQYYQYTVSEKVTAADTATGLCEIPSSGTGSPPSQLGLLFPSPQYSVARVLLTAGDKEKAAKDEKNPKIDISGSITLPAPAAPKK